MVSQDISEITVVARPAMVGTCGLCARPGVGLRAALTVTRSGGTVASMDACEACERAVHRLGALASGLTRFFVGASIPEPHSEVVAAVLGNESAALSVAIHMYRQTLLDSDGATYLPVAVGRQRPDGTWEGWLEFREIEGPAVLTTTRETTQPNWDTLVYWASGLQPSYLEGAFKRTHRMPYARQT